MKLLMSEAVPLLGDYERKMRKVVIWSAPGSEPGGSRGRVVLSRWLVQVGDYVKRDQPIAHLSGQSLDFELPSPYQGQVLNLNAPAGEPLEPDVHLLTIETHEDH